MRPLLTSRAAADLLRLHPDTVKRLARTGELACVRIGRALRFTPEDLEAFVAARRTHAQPAPLHAAVSSPPVYELGRGVPNPRAKRRQQQ